jgi:hypothetical protein
MVIQTLSQSPPYQGGFRGIESMQPIDRPSISSLTDRNVGLRWNNRPAIVHKASFILEYTECRADRSNAIVHTINVTAEHTEFTAYTSNAIVPQPSVNRSIAKTLNPNRH